MKTITKFKAYDGSEFDDEQKCSEYETNCRHADDIISQLYPRPDDSDFSNGNLGYIQHDPVMFLKVRQELLEQANIESPHKWIDQSIEDTTVHPSWAFRWISECCTGRLNRAWNRIYCTDDKFREWGQPYFRDNHDKARCQKRINP